VIDAAPTAGARASLAHALRLVCWQRRFGSYYGTGLAAAGLIPGRPHDEMGIAVAIGRNGFSYMQSQLQQGIPVNRAETAIELTYLAQINDWLAISRIFSMWFVPIPTRPSRTRSCSSYERK
jgi:hypothetical protein